MRIMKISVIGCGRWGSLITWYLAEKKGLDVTLYGREGSEHIQRFIKERKMNFDGIDGIYVIRPYTEAQKVFEDIKNKKGTHIFTIFSWNQEVDSDDR